MIKKFVRFWTLLTLIHQRFKRTIDELVSYANSSFFAAVAQLDSALGFYPSGCGFESHQLHEKLRSPPHLWGILLYLVRTCFIIIYVVFVESTNCNHSWSVLSSSLELADSVSLSFFRKIFYGEIGRASCRERV